MEAEGAELGLSGGPFPPGTLDHLRGLLAALHEKAESPPEIGRKQELDRISDVVVRSALELCDEDMAEAEAASITPHHRSMACNCRLTRTSGMRRLKVWRQTAG